LQNLVLGTGEVLNHEPSCGLGIATLDGGNMMRSIF
jgi:hypothetical protein